MIAGVATSDELETLSRQVSQVMAASSSGTRELQRQTDKLASISQLTNERIDISNAKINDIREQLQGFAVTTRVSLVSANNFNAFHGQTTVSFTVSHDTLGNPFYGAKRCC